jgi:hypothetical protein
VKIGNLYNQLLIEAIGRNVISANELQKIQSVGNPSSDIIFGMEDTDTFILTDIKISDIAAPKGLSLQFYKRRGLDEDISIVNRIIKALSNNEKVTAFVIDTDNKIMDGLHRYVAAKYYYGENGLIKVYKQMSVELNENMNTNLKPVDVNKFVYHKSNTKFRVEISKNGLIPKAKSETWLSDTPISGKVIFATNSDDKKDWFDSTYNDDIYQIDTSNLNNKWFEDPNYSNDKEEWAEYNGKKFKLPKTNIEYKHIITFEPIPVNSLKLIYKGTGESTF